MFGLYFVTYPDLIFATNHNFFWIFTSMGHQIGAILVNSDSRVLDITKTILSAKNEPKFGAGACFFMRIYFANGDSPSVYYYFLLNVSWRFWWQICSGLNLKTVNQKTTLKPLFICSSMFASLSVQFVSTKFSVS